MSASTALAVASLALSPSPVSMPVDWAHVLGVGSFSAGGLGHHVTANAAGEALVSGVASARIRTGLDGRESW